MALFAAKPLMNFCEMFLSAQDLLNEQKSE